MSLPVLRNRWIEIAAVLVCLGVQPTAMLAQSPTAESGVEIFVGDTAPQFEGVDERGERWRLEDHLGEGAIVLCFYPGDFGAGCAKQTQLFRDRLNELAERGVCVVAVSGDASATHALFKEMHDLRFALLADEQGALAKRYGVAVAEGCKVRVTDATGRSVLDANRRFLILNRPATLAAATFIIGKDGNVLHHSPRDNPLDPEVWDQYLAARD